MIDRLLPYSKDAESAFDLSSYLGRVKHFGWLIDQRNFFYTDSTLEEYAEKLKKFEKGEYTTSNEELWKMKYVLLGNYHPESNQPIPRLVRTSGICLVNIPIIIGLSFIPPTPLN